MQTIVATFDSRADAQHAAERLVGAGFAAGRVHLHEQDTPPRNADGVTADEYASGGFFTNFKGLLDGLFDARQRDRDADSYAELVRREGVGLTVDVESEADAQRAEALLGDCAAMEVARAPAIAGK